MDKKPLLHDFWVWLGYPEEKLVTIDRKFFVDNAKQAAKAYFFPVIAIWYVCTGKPKKVSELFRELIA